MRIRSNFKKISIILIFIGVMGLGLTAVFGLNTVTYLHKINVEGITYYEYDFASYMYNLANSFQSTSELTLSNNPLQWEQITLTNTWTALGNDLAFIFNWLIFGLNIILYPFRIGAYVLTIVGSLLGLPITTYDGQTPLAWLYVMINFVKGLEIPMITF